MANLVTKIIISATDQASNVFDAIQRNAGKLATAVAGYFGFKLFSASVDSARDFESAMSRVGAASGATAEELAQLKAAAEEAGASTQYTSVEAAAALENLAKAGLSASDAVATLPAVLDLATAGGVDLATSSDFISKAVAGMGLSFQDAGRVADVLAKGANASNTSVTGLAQALSYAAPLANSLGLSLEQTVAIIGKFADAGIDASRAGTALNSILAQFSDPASKFRRELASAGIITGDFDQALRQLAAAGPAGQKAILAVGQEAGPALRALLNQGIGSLDELKAKLDDSAGSARTFAKVMSDNLDGASKGLGSAWEALKIKLGEPILVPLKEQVDLLANGLREFVSNGTAVQFGESITEAFKAGAAWVRGFVAEIDFTAVYARLQKFAGDAKAFFEDIGRSATNAGNVFKFAWNTMSAGTNLVMAGFYKIGEAFAGVASNIVTGVHYIAKALQAITFGGVSDRFAQAVEETRIKAEAFWAVSETFSKKAGESFDQASDAATAAAKAWSDMTAPVQQAAVQMGSAAKKIAEVGAEAEAVAARMAGLKSANELAKKSFEDLGINGHQLSAKLAEISAQTGVTVTSTRALRDAVRNGSIAFDAATGSWTKGSGALAGVNEASAAVVVAMSGFKKGLVDGASGAKALADQSGDTAKKIRALTEQYKAFIATGDTQAAAKVFVEMQSELDKTKVKAEDTAEAVDAAFTRLGVKSSKEMNRVAESYRRDYEIIRSSGTASAEDIAAAYDAFVKAAIAGSNDIVKSMRGIEAPAGAIATELERAVGAASGHELDALVDKINALAAVGRLSSTEVRGLAAAVEEARERSEDAVPGIQSIGEAFRKLGVESPESLKRTADAAEEAFDLILSGGREVKDQLPAAFEAYANAAIAANGGVADATIEAQAAQYGFKVETDETGKSIVRAMTEAEKAVNRLADATKNAPDGMGDLGEAIADAAASASGLTSSMTQAGVATRSAGEIIEKFTQAEIIGYQDVDQARARYVRNLMQSHNDRMNAADAESRALDNLARQQDRLNSSAARGVDDLKLRLLELNGTEDEIARARRDRDKADVERQIALLELEMKRARLKDEDLGNLRAEIKLLKEQLGLIDQVFRAEERNAKQGNKNGGDSGGSRSGGDSSGGSGNGPRPPTTNTAPRDPARTVTVNLNIGGKTIPVTTTESNADALIRELESAQSRS